METSLSGSKLPGRYKAISRVWCWRLLNTLRITCCRQGALQSYLQGLMLETERCEYTTYRDTLSQSHLQGLVLETGHWRGFAYRSAGLQSLLQGLMLETTRPFRAIRLGESLQSHLQGLVLETTFGNTRNHAGGRCKAISRVCCWRPQD